MSDYKQCSRCILDSNIPQIKFDQGGVCSYCKLHEELEELFPLNEDGKNHLNSLVEKIKKSGRKKEYDCVVGVSGGRDSTYTLYLAKKLGLKPLAVHFDNGWNSEIAVTNIQNAVTKLDVDLYTKVANWDEFKSLQISFLKASVSDAEIPTDVAIFGTLHQVAAEEGIKYIINGHSFRTEGVVPLGWTYMDGKYINSVHKMFGGKPLRSIPNFTLWDMISYSVFKGIKVVPLLNYFHYSHEEVNKILERELNWKYYGGHHHESYFTHFFQSFYLPKKFKIDKRRLELSALIRSGQISRDLAIKEFEKPYEFKQELVDYTIKKLGITKEDFEKILAADNKMFSDYPTYYPLIKTLKLPIQFAHKIGLVNPILYYKFFA